jgi:hypothetical protein
MTKKLVEAFDENRRQKIKEELRNAQSLPDIKSIIHKELLHYSTLGGEYLRSLTESEAKTALAVLSILRESNDFLTPVLEYSRSPVEKAYIKEFNELFPKQDTILITIGAGLGAALGLNIGMGILPFLDPLGAVVMGAVVGSGSAKVLSEAIKQRSFSTQSEEKFQIRFNIENLILELEKLFERIDKLVLNQKSFPSQPKIIEKNTKLSNFPELLKFIQKIVGSSFKGTSDALDYALDEELIPILEIYGFQVHNLSIPDLENLDSLPSDVYQMYEVIPTNRVTQPSIVIPAILEEEKVVLRGKVYFPGT